MLSLSSPSPSSSVWRRGGECGDRIDDFLVAGAAAQCARDRLADLLPRRRAASMLVEVGFRRQYHPRDTVAALNRAVPDEGVLQGMEALRIAQSLDRDDPAPAAERGEQDAGVYRASIEQHSAHPAFRLEAILLAAEQADLRAQDVKQRPMRLDEKVVAFSVHGERDRDASRPHERAPSARSTHRRNARGTSASTSR